MKQAWLYLVLVGLPALALIGILKAGEGLTAPMAIGGEWTVEADLTRLSSDCAAGLAEVRQPTLQISQSGPQVSLTLKDGRTWKATGRVEDQTLTTATVEGTTVQGSACTPESGFWLRATVVRLAEATRLEGMMGNSLCEACGPVPFRAVRARGASRNAGSR